MTSRILASTLLAAGLVVSATAAQAADKPIKAPVYKAPVYKAPPVVTYDWSGFYIGAHAGGAWGDTTSTGTAGAPFDDVVGTAVNVRPGGWMAGIQLGYNWQVDRYVFGIEGDLGYLGLKSDMLVGRGGTNSDFASVHYGWYGVLAGRAGYAFDTTLLYAKGGLALARISNEVSDLDSGVIDATDFTSVSGVRAGWAIGAGLEYALSRQWTMKAEYLYMDFGTRTSANLDGDTYEHDNTVHTAKLGLNYRFGAGPVVAKY